MTAELLSPKPKSAPSADLSPGAPANDAPFLDEEAARTAKSRQQRLLMLSAAGAALAIAAVAAVTHINFGGAAAPAEVDQTQVVTVEQLSKHAFNPRITLTGEVRPRRDIHVFAPVSGVRVLQLLKDEGDNVRAGEPLARLDAGVAEAQIAMAQASVAEAESAAVRAKGEYERAESIRDSGALSAEAIEQRRAASVAADARLAAARAQLQETNTRLGGGFVRAPVGGLVISRSVQLGAMVDGQEMFRIAGDNTLEIRADIAEGDILSLRIGQVASFRLSDGSTVQATLSRAPASIDDRTRTGEALFSLPANTTLRAGMHISGDIQLSERQTLAVAQDAIRYEGGRSYVFVLDKDNVAHRTWVNLGGRNGDLVEITSGIEDGARVAGSGAAFLSDGDKVRPFVPEAPATKPAEQTQSFNTEDLRGRFG